MLSDFRKRKLTRFFEVVDSDGDGVFTHADTELVGARLAALRGLKAGTPDYDNFIAGFSFYWQDVRDASDANADGKVTLEEWLAYHDGMLADEQRYAATAANSAGLMFALVDKDGDGKISTDEYGDWMRAWGMTDDETFAGTMAKLDPGGSGAFSRDEVLAFTRDFFYSEDADAPGNWAMGPF